ncbi:hypothetical protein [Flavobacterium seoulense]|uniref:hypothetical protein n=1 Tax=Flavobacterium seoulense TaxID=1492738 RepID=UPI00054D235F|nr:hypothetical protein [Flavobacterium seoulense]
MNYIQGDNIFIVIGCLLFSIAIIVWIRIGDVKETKRLNEKGLEMDSYTKSKSWRVYIIGGIGIIASLFEILKRLYYFFALICVVFVNLCLIT